MVQQMLGPLCSDSSHSPFLMEMSMWLNSSDGLCVHVCIMEWHACESGRVDGRPCAGGGFK